MTISECIEAIILALKDADGKHPKVLADKLPFFWQAKTFSSFNFYLTELLNSSDLPEGSKASLVALQESIQPNLESERTERDCFGNLKSRAEFETSLAMSLLTGADASSFQKINQKMVDYLEKHKEALSDKNYAILASLEQYKIPFSRELAPIDALIDLLKRPLDGPNRANIICESASLHLLFFNYRSVYQPEREAVDETQKKQIVDEKARLHRKLRPKNSGEMFEETTRGRQRVSSVFRTSDFGITEPDSTLPQWRNFHNYEYTPHKFRVSPNRDSPIVQTFQKEGVPFIAGPSGTAGDCLEGLHFLLPDITPLERQSYLNLLAAAEVGLGHHSMHEIMLTACNINALPTSIFRDDVSVDRPIWERINYQTSYQFFLTEEFKQSAAGISLKEAYPQFFSAQKETPKSVKKSKPKMDAATAVLKLQRQFRAKLASKKFHQATYWTKHELAVPKSAIDKKQFFIKEKSHYNIQQLMQEFEVKKMSEEEKRFLRFFMSCNFDLSHYTLSTKKIVDSGMLLSYDRLYELTRGQGFVNNSSADVEALKNSGYVFFRMELIHNSKMGSRFGSDQFIFDGRKTDFLEHGFVSLYEMLAPYTASTCKSLQYKDHTVREYVTESYVNGTFKYRYGPTELPFDVADTIFYGPDIMKGIALAFLREVRRVGGLFEADFLNLFKESITDEVDTKFSIDPSSMKYQHTLSTVNKYLSDLFRLEAKIPSVVYIKHEQVKISQPRRFQIAIDNQNLEEIESILTNETSDPTVITYSSTDKMTPITYALFLIKGKVVNFFLEKKVILSPDDISNFKKNIGAYAGSLSQKGFQHFLEQIDDVSFLREIASNQFIYSKLIPLLNIKQLVGVFKNFTFAETVYALSNSKSIEDYEKLALLFESDDVKEFLNSESAKSIIKNLNISKLIFNCLKLGNQKAAWTLFSSLREYVNVFSKFDGESCYDLLKESVNPSPFKTYCNLPTSTLLLQAIKAQNTEMAIHMRRELGLTYSQIIDGQQLITYAEQASCQDLVIDLLVPEIQKLIENNMQSAALFLMKTHIPLDDQADLACRMIGNKSLIQLAYEKNPNGEMVKHFESDPKVMLFLSICTKNEDEAIKFLQLKLYVVFDKFNGKTLEELAMASGMKRLYQIIQQRNIYSLILNSNQMLALEKFKECQDIVTIFDVVKGITLFQIALEKDSNGVLLEYVKSDPDVFLLLTLYKEEADKAFQLMKTRNLTIESKIGGKSILEWAILFKRKEELCKLVSLDKLKFLLQFPNQEAAFEAFKAINEVEIVFSRIDGKTILQHIYESNPKGTLTFFLKTYPNLDLFLAIVAKNEKEIRRLIREKIASGENLQKLPHWPDMEDWAKEFGCEIMEESLYTTPVLASDNETMPPIEEDTVYLSDEKFNLLMKELPKLIQTASEFQSIMKDLSKTQKEKLYDAVVDRLLGMIKADEPDDYLAIFNTLTPTQAKLFCQHIKPILVQQRKVFIHLLMGLPEDKNKTIYEVMEDQLVEMVKTASEYCDLLSSLPKSRANDARIRLEKHLPNIIHDPYDFLKIIDSTTTDTRDTVYKQIKSNLPLIIKSTTDLKRLSTVLDREDLITIATTLKDKIYTAQEFCTLMSLSYDDGYRKEIYQTNTDKFSGFIHNSHDIFSVMLYLDSDSCIEFSKKNKELLLKIAIRDTDSFDTYMTILGQDKLEIILNTLKSYLIDWVNDRLQYLKKNPNESMTNYYTDAISRITATDKDTLWAMYKELLTDNPAEIESKDGSYLSGEEEFRSTPSVTSPVENMKLKEKLKQILPTVNRSTILNKLDKMKTHLINEKDQLLDSYIVQKTYQVMDADEAQLSTIDDEINEIFRSVSSPEVKAVLQEIDTLKNNSYKKQAKRLEKALMNLPLEKRGAVITGPKNPVQEIWKTLAPGMKSDTAKARFKKIRADFLKLKTSDEEKLTMKEELIRYKTEANTDTVIKSPQQRDQ